MHNFKIKENVSCSLTTKNAKNTENEMLGQLWTLYIDEAIFNIKDLENLLSRWDLGTIQTDVLLTEKEAKII
jgi:hypothetical protein